MRPIRDYIPELLEFEQDCKKAGVYVPFKFHAGETLQDGDMADRNIVDAYMLRARRIGHGYALVRQPFMLERFKKRIDYSVECCPISNEILHLCHSIAGHSIYTLIANNVNCNVNSDNSVFYR